MNRREFLEAFPAAVAGVPMLTNLPSIAINSPAEPTNATKSIRPWSIVDSGARVSAAAFHSALWGEAGDPAIYEKFWLPARRREFPDETFINIAETELVPREGAAPALAIALAHPDDALSWNAALDACRAARDAGSLTLLLAAYSYPDCHDRFDIRIVTRHREWENASGPHMVVSFVTMNAYADLANIAFLFAHYDNLLLNVDFQDFRSVLLGSRQAYLLEGVSHGKQRSREASRFALEPLRKHPSLPQRINGALVFVELGAVIFKLWETRNVTEMFQQILPRDISYIFVLVGRRGVDPFMKVTALLTVDES